MPAHHDCDAPAEALREQVAQLARADEADALEFRDAIRKHAALVVNDAMRLANLGQTYAGRRMRMHHAADVGAGRVGACMNPELAVRRALAREQFSIRVENQQRLLVGEPG